VPKLAGGITSFVAIEFIIDIFSVRVPLNFTLLGVNTVLAHIIIIAVVLFSCHGLGLLVCSD